MLTQLFFGEMHLRNVVFRFRSITTFIDMEKIDNSIMKIKAIDTLRPLSGVEMSRKN